MFNKELELTIDSAYDYARSKYHSWLTKEHLFIALLNNKAAIKMLVSLNMDIDLLHIKLKHYLNEVVPLYFSEKEPICDPKPTAEFESFLQNLLMSIGIQKEADINGSDILYALLKETDICEFLKGHNLLEEEEYQAFLQKLSKSLSVPTSKNFQSQERQSENKISKYLININNEVQKNSSTQVVGRENEINQIINILCRCYKNNPIIIGEPGVGKTAIVEGLANRILSGHVPKQLKNNLIYTLDMTGLLAGARYRGDFEERVKHIIHYINAHPNTILFIDEIHMIVNTGAANGDQSDLASLLKPELARGTLRCIGATTAHEYRHGFGDDKALLRRFQAVHLSEPSISETVEILKSLKLHFESYHEIEFSLPALTAAAELSEKYLRNRSLPDKAIDIIDEAGAYFSSNLEGKPRKRIMVNDIKYIIARMTNMPKSMIHGQNHSNIHGLGHKLKAVIFNQNEAITSLVNTIKIAKTGLNKHTKPIGSFLFLGPTGVGKTELSNQLAASLGVTLVRFDMSEYMEKHDVSKLIGAPPGYVGHDHGGKLCDLVSQHPHAILLLDEIEKAHPDVFNILLQVMDYGTLTAGDGTLVDFRNTLIIMTSNAGVVYTSAHNVGFINKGQAAYDLDEKYVEGLFSAEFRNRLNGIIKFNSLNTQSVYKIIDKFMQDIVDKVKTLGAKVKIGDEVKQWLYNKGYSPESGARPLESAIQQYVKLPIADLILAKQIKPGCTIHISIKADALVFTVKKR